MMPGTSHQVFEMLMDSKQHAAFTGEEASISRNIGGSFTTFGGWAQGKNVELVADKKIVQTWRADDWPADHFSTITIKLIQAPKGTKVLFAQIDVPANKAEDIAQGWREYYWVPMKRALLAG
jgi:activator of HSP90 ATPase